ncbi:uncharacterized protein LOC125660297 [Ostrea edulis]|uniref:uncharacterized protein LOC125660297 n=1 Tax=Ostrea edulis TaxID=37623 RepID=UPI0024AFD67B|nr:uncharacterized protein LOC125660297 [Ostrea edulis]
MQPRQSSHSAEPRPLKEKRKFTGKSRLPGKKLKVQSTPTAVANAGVNIEEVASSVSELILPELKQAIQTIITQRQDSVLSSSRNEPETSEKSGPSSSVSTASPDVEQRIYVLINPKQPVPNEGQEKSIWIGGSSIIKRAFQRARLSTEKSHLGLRRLNYHILWQGKGGLTWKKLFLRIQLLRRYESFPEILIIHCGGNDIGNVPLLELRLRMKETFQRIRSELPNTLLGWSHILPRFSWRYSKNVRSQKIAVKRINSFMSKLFVVNNGFYISYPEISWDSSGLFVNDGVHLSELGNDLLLYNLQSKLQQVCSFNGERRTRSMPYSDVVRN